VDLRGNCIERVRGAANEVYVRTLPREGAGNNAADRARRPVDHSSLVRELHRQLPATDVRVEFLHLAAESHKMEAGIARGRFISD
jgi:hypothetical protein